MTFEDCPAVFGRKTPIDGFRAKHHFSLDGEHVVQMNVQIARLNGDDPDAEHGELQKDESTAKNGTHALFEQYTQDEEGRV